MEKQIRWVGKSPKFTDDGLILEHQAFEEAEGRKADSISLSGMDRVFFSPEKSVSCHHFRSVIYIAYVVCNYSTTESCKME